MPESTIEQSIQLGVCKFNVNTEVRLAYMQALKDEICGASSKDLLEIAGEAIEAMQEVIAEKLQLFGSVNKAHLHINPYATILTAQAHNGNGKHNSSLLDEINGL